MYDPAYIREEDWIVHKYELETGNTLRFAAKDVRRESTGTHAVVAISFNWVQLAWTNFNIERDEDRVRLSNSAWKHMDGREHDLDRAEFPQNIFKHALDLFCAGLWEEKVGMEIGGMMAGDPDIQPARRLLGDYVLEDAGTILFAPPGEGKSYTALAWADCIQWGIESIWPVTSARMPLYINVERSARSMAARLARVHKALGLDPCVEMPFLNARGKSLADIYEAAKKTIKKEGASVVFYDSISRAGFGAMAKDDVANKTMDMLNALSPTWIALAHSPRGDESHVFGSQMFDAAADLTVQLRSQTAADSRTTGIGLEVGKANDIPKGPMQVHVFEWSDDGLDRIRKGRAGEFAELDASQKRGLEQQIRELLTHQGPMSGSAIADELGKNRSNIATLLSHSDKFVLVRREGKTSLYGVREEQRV